MIKSLYLVPHGGVIVPGLEEEYNEKARILHESMLKVQKEIQEDKIKLIFLVSPHGYQHPTDFLIYLHQVFEGFQIISSEEENNKRMVKQFMWPGNLEVSQLLIKMLREAGIPASPFIQADVNYPLKLAWGETIPLTYIASSEGPQIVILSPPVVSISHKNSKDQLKEVGKFFKLLGDSPFLKDTPVSIVISGDLSHKHDPNHEYGFHETSKTYDSEVVEWTKNPAEDKLTKLFELNETADSCGISGIAIIQGIMKSLTTTKWKNSFSVYKCPTYFGMIVSAWRPE